jgi:hypothetical protein
VEKAKNEISGELHSVDGSRMEIIELRWEEADR